MVFNLIQDVKTPDSVKARIAELLVGTPEEVATAVKSIEKNIEKSTEFANLIEKLRLQVMN